MQGARALYKGEGGFVWELRLSVAELGLGALRIVRVAYVPSLVERAYPCVATPELRDEFPEEHEVLLHILDLVRLLAKALRNGVPVDLLEFVEVAAVLGKLFECKLDTLDEERLLFLGRGEEVRCSKMCCQPRNQEHSGDVSHGDVVHGGTSRTKIGTSLSVSWVGDPDANGCVLKNQRCALEIDAARVFRLRLVTNTLYSSVIGDEE